MGDISCCKCAYLVKQNKTLAKPKKTGKQDLLLSGSEDVKSLTVLKSWAA